MAPSFFGVAMLCMSSGIAGAGAASLSLSAFGFRAGLGFCDTVGGDQPCAT